jgi:hypothetical protein
MDYKPISAFLDKFKKIIVKDDEAKELIAAVVERHVGLALSQKSIAIKKGVIVIQGSPLFRSELWVHREGILADIQNLLPDRIITDIR